VDVKKLEKQEMKLRAKIEKRAKQSHSLYEGSRLLDQAKKQQSYEEMFMKVNPLASADAKNKSKDIHLPNIDVSFASNRILSVIRHIFV
jgi:ATP-binding cassette subfamily F protein 3